MGSGFLWVVIEFMLLLLLWGKEVLTRIAFIALPIPNLDSQCISV